MTRFFEKGDRIRLSAAGIARSKGDRLGTVIGFSRDDYPRIWWDGNRHADWSSIHPSFITLAPDWPISAVRVKAWLEAS